MSDVQTLSKSKSLNKNILPNWNNLTSTKDVDAIINDVSSGNVSIIMKHSTSCPISSIAKLRLDQDGHQLGDHINWYYLDLLSNRSVSNYIADRLNVHHESPQVIVVKNGEVTYDNSHLDITINDLSDQVSVSA